MAGEVIPFGKYKGQPIEVAVQDRQYVDWLTAQPWFRERFANLYTLVINNFQEPTETPEHNALQAKFLSDEFCQKFLAFAFPDAGLGSIATQFEEWSFDVQLWGDRFHCSIECKPKIGDDYPAVLRQIKNAMRFETVWEGHSRIKHYPNGNPVLFLEEYVGIGATTDQFIEIFEKSGIRVVFLDDVLDSPIGRE